MDDVLFIGLAGGIVGYVDERYGRAAAWLAARVMVAAFVALIAGSIWWVAR